LTAGQACSGRQGASLAWGDHGDSLVPTCIARELRQLQPCSAPVPSVLANSGYVLPKGRNHSLLWADAPILALAKKRNSLFFRVIRRFGLPETGSPVTTSTTTHYLGTAFLGV